MINSGNPEKTDFLIIGAGVVGLALARACKLMYPQKSVLVVDKEDSIGRHASGLNSGVLHAGFYYTADSLKAKFCRDGNQAWKEFCLQHGVAVNASKKIVVAQNETELDGLQELIRRGRVNQVEISEIDEKQLREIDPNVKTFQKALLSPNTATVDPLQCLIKLAKVLEHDHSVKIITSTKFVKKLAENAILVSGNKTIEFGHLINAAGLYADQIAKEFGASEHYEIMPFKGLYLKYEGAYPPVRVNVYPVPNLNNPFLGVHFTVTQNGSIKIGPTATPAFWRENYLGFGRFAFSEMSRIVLKQSELFVRNSFGFRSLAITELKKYSRSHFVDLASRVVHQLDRQGFKHWTKPGIRAQLLDKRTNLLVQDFVVETPDNRSTHVLNAISPAFTSALPFGEWVVREKIAPRVL